MSEYEDGRITGWRENRVYRLPSGEVISVYDDITARKQAEEGLLHLAAIVESSNDAIIGKTLDGIITSWNKGAERMYGYSKEDVIGKPVSLLIPPGHEDEVPRILDHIRSGSVVERYETVRRTKDGRDVHVSLVVSPIRGLKGNVVGASIIARDVTERKRAEEALRTSETQLSNALKMAHAGHWEYDVASDTFTFNDNFYRIFRTTAAEVGGYKMRSADYARRFCHPDDLPVVAKEIQAASETKDPNCTRQLEHRILYADGEVGYIAVRIIIVKDEQGRTVKTFGVNQDITERKRAEAAIRASEQKYRELVENINDVIFTVMTDGTVTFASPAVRNTLGYEPEELIGHPYEPLIDPADRDLVRAAVREALAGKLHVNEFRMFAKSGDTRWVRTSSTPILGDEGPIGIRGVLTDITERKRAEEALLLAEQRYRTLFEQSPDGVVILDTATASLIEFNDQACRQLGYTREEFARLTIADLDVVETRADTRMRIDGVLRDGKTDFETRQKSKQGEIRDVEVTAQPILVAGKTVYHCIWRDITERKKAEAAIRRQSEFLQRMIDSMPYPVFYKDNQCRYLGCNRAFEVFFGTSRDKLVGEKPHDIASKELADVYLKADRDLLDHPGTQVYESVIQSADGVQHDVVFHKATFTGVDGELAGIIGAVLDITDRKKAEQAVQEQLDELRRWHEATLGREGRILELKREVNRLLETAGLPGKYESAQDAGGGKP